MQEQLSKVVKKLSVVENPQCLDLNTLMTTLMEQAESNSKQVFPLIDDLITLGMNNTYCKQLDNEQKYTYVTIITTCLQRLPSKLRNSSSLLLKLFYLVYKFMASVS